jgi:hypothetical protein
VNERRVRVSSLSLVVAVSTFEQRTAHRYNNTHCTYGVNLQHEGSISELHCVKSFFSCAREDRTLLRRAAGCGVGRKRSDLRVIYLIHI